MTDRDDLRPAPRRRGRLPAAEREERRQAVLDAALAELVEHGYERLTMLSVAGRAGASKETLYAWFGSRDGLVAALIQRNADESAAGVAGALTADADPADVLRGYAAGLLRLLTGPASVALNRAAMSSPDLAHLLLRAGRHRIGPLVESYLAAQHEAGAVHVPDPAAAFRLLYGLVVEDTQIRVLLGERPPPATELVSHAGVAVERFLRLVAPEDATCASDVAGTPRRPLRGPGGPARPDAGRSDCARAEP